MSPSLQAVGKRKIINKGRLVTKYLLFVFKGTLSEAGPHALRLQAQSTGSPSELEL